jgi:hypothetical protein
VSGFGGEQAIMAAAFLLILLGALYLRYETLLRLRIPAKADSIIRGIGIMLITGGIVLIVLNILNIGKTYIGI